MSAPDCDANRAWDDSADGAMTIRAAVAFSGISRSRLYDLMRGGKLRFTHVGTRRLIYRRSLRELLAHGNP